MALNIAARRLTAVGEAGFSFAPTEQQAVLLLLTLIFIFANINKYFVTH